MSTFCRYQCPAHHGVYVHTPDCPVIPERSVCDGCVAEITASRPARRKLTVGEAIIALVPGAEGADILKNVSDEPVRELYGVDDFGELPDWFTGYGKPGGKR